MGLLGCFNFMDGERQPVKFSSLLKERDIFCSVRTLICIIDHHTVLADLSVFCTVLKCGNRRILIERQIEQFKEGMCSIGSEKSSVS